MNKKLYKSSTDKKLCGVLGGIAAYLNMDSSVVRIIYILLSFCTAFSPVIIYIIMALVIPDEPTYTDYNGNNNA